MWQLLSMIARSVSGSYYIKSRLKDRNCNWGNWLRRPWMEPTRLERWIRFRISSAEYDTYRLPTERAFKSEISTVDGQRKILCVAICHCKVDFDLNCFALARSWILVKQLNRLIRINLCTVSVLYSNFTLVVFASLVLLWIAHFVPFLVCHCLWRIHHEHTVFCSVRMGLPRDNRNFVRWRLLGSLPHTSPE